eukprot:g2112.t1
MGVATFCLALTLLKPILGEPAAGTSRTCVSGELCVITGIAGTGLANGDFLAVLPLCGVGPALTGMPGGFGESLPATSGGTHFIWPGVILVDGGEYRLCWSGLTGQGLLDGDRIMLLKVCGVGPIVPGFPNADIAIASGGGSSYSFGASDFITAGGGEYAMCWCQPGNGNVCTGPTNFLTNVGILIVTGAASDHDLSCVQGFDCQVTNFRGVGLADGDQIQVLLECGTGSSIANWPNQGIAVATGGGSEYLSWQGTSLAVQFGNYRICWCMLGWDCTTTAPGL